MGARREELSPLVCPFDIRQERKSETSDRERERALFKTATPPQKEVKEGKISSTPIPLLSLTLSMTNNGGVRAGSRVGYGITDRQSRGEGGQRAHPHTPKNLHSPVAESSQNVDHRLRERESTVQVKDCDIPSGIIGCVNASPLFKQKIVMYPVG